MLHHLVFPIIRNRSLDNQKLLRKKFEGFQNVDIPSSLKFYHRIAFQYLNVSIVMNSWIVFNQQNVKISLLEFKASIATIMMTKLNPEIRIFGIGNYSKKH